ncbi:uncharacterized protein KY384_008886 [Bacidia gigantensis]|uniref:uncharacterized protein n=1 Tax=Bacidia gigantensis TaxID=2732470 RepID=UPI001D057549|nr:uncharacterized protein KY384_008886 [Bacidia gigantensis]KAG8525242.1 hypothetical protein KY384_008886 [Bacidia gigantensis]
MVLRLAAAFAAAALASSTFAQVSTKCDPTKNTCPPDKGLGTSSYFIDFTTLTTKPSDWTYADQTVVTYNTKNRKNGAELEFLKKHDAPLMATDFTFLFGRVDAVVQAAPGPGIVTSVILLSDDLDEIDWEWRGSYDNIVQTNWFGRGVTGNYNHSTSPGVASPFKNFRTYSFDWNQERLNWEIDGKVVRTLKASDCVGTQNQYPQSPMKVSLSLWDAGDPDAYNSWGGGKTPIPPPADGYSFYVKSVKISNMFPAQWYTYGDKTGSFQSIKRENKTLPSSATSLTSTASQSMSLNPRHTSESQAPTPASSAPPASSNKPASSAPPASSSKPASGVDQSTLHGSSKSGSSAKSTSASKTSGSSHQSSSTVKTITTNGKTVVTTVPCSSSSHSTSSTVKTITTSGKTVVTTVPCSSSSRSSSSTVKTITTSGKTILFNGQNHHYERQDSRDDSAMFVIAQLRQDYRLHNHVRLKDHFGNRHYALLNSATAKHVFSYSFASEYEQVFHYLHNRD